MCTFRRIVKLSVHINECKTLITFEDGLTKQLYINPSGFVFRQNMCPPSCSNKSNICKANEASIFLRHHIYQQFSSDASAEDTAALQEFPADINKDVISEEIQQQEFSSVEQAPSVTNMIQLQPPSTLHVVEPITTTWYTEPKYAVIYDYPKEQLQISNHTWHFQNCKNRNCSSKSTDKCYCERVKRIMDTITALVGKTLIHLDNTEVPDQNASTECTSLHFNGSILAVNVNLQELNRLLELQTKLNNRPSFSLLSLVVGLYLLNFSIALIILNKDVQQSRGMLYPTDSETREVRSLDGIWNFARSEETDPMQGVRDKWYKDDLSKVRETIPMPVPASYNDITTEQALRDHVGIAWYDRKFFVPRSWAKEQRVWLRFGSVHYKAFVWVNGELAVKHEMGHLPFEAEVTHLLKYGAENRITVMCDNALTQTTVPQGRLSEEANDNGVSIVQSYSFDFFNYAGIHRSVQLYTTPKTFIGEVEVHTDLANENSVGYVYYTISVNGSAANEADNALYARVQLYDRNGVAVANATSDAKLTGMLQVEKVNPWWPYLMHPEPGYLYELEIKLHAGNEELLDVYRLNVGIRTLSWTNETFLINGKPVYFRGFGRHEDADVRGKGLDYALLTRDFNLLKWIGANAYRTSHYPYSEESMQFADRHGIMIIDECPSVDTENYNQVLLGKHKSSLEQLIHRDRNHPSVVMWSIANEPSTSQVNAGTYFQFVTNYARSLDSTRPITAAISTHSDNDEAARYLDIISFNRYNGWYSNPGRLDMIKDRVVDEAIDWNAKHNKPVLMSEYGADTIEGLHLQPSYVWSEEYQTDLFSRHFRAFDLLRRKKWFIGEFVWNFADFKTAQTYTRVAGNKKGVFTRSRQPKAVAHLLRKRYYALGREMDQCSFPEDLFTYIAESGNIGKHESTEL